MLFDDDRDDDADADEARPSPQGKIVPFPGRRPDWLTGPGEDPCPVPDAAAPGPSPVPTPALRRPGAAPEEAAPAIEPGLEPTAMPAPALRRPGPPATSTDAAPAAPRPRVIELEPALQPAVEWASDAAPAAEPVSPVECAPAGPVRGRSRLHASDPAAPWVPVASSVPVLKLTLPEQPVLDEQPQQDPVAPTLVPPRALPGRDEDLRQPAVTVGPTATAQPEAVPLAEPWWIVAADTLRTSRRVQLALAGALVVAVLLALWMWPRGVGTTPLSDVRRHPGDYDGRTVVVRGRVGDDVFSVGNGCAFYLMQGRDTIVVFSRSRWPRVHDVVTIKGQVSTGFLDGVPRQALFEDDSPAPKK